MEYKKAKTLKHLNNLFYLCSTIQRENRIKCNKPISTSFSIDVFYTLGVVYVQKYNNFNSFFSNCKYERRLSETLNTTRFVGVGENLYITGTSDNIIENAVDNWASEVSDCKIRS